MPNRRGDVHRARRRLPLMVLVLTTIALYCGVSTAYGCAVDGVPSIMVDGQRVALNQQQPDARTWRVWALFVAPHSVAAGTTVTLLEERRYVTLPAEGFRRPWRWRIDGSAMAHYGTKVSIHLPGRGLHKVTVDAYIASRHQWLEFDAVTLDIR